MALPRVLCRVRLLLNNDISVVSKYSSFIKSASINKCVHFRPARHFRTIFPGVVLNKDEKNTEKKDEKNTEKKESGSSSSTSSSSSDSDLSDSDSDIEDDVTVEYHRGLPQFTIPLPSRKERCRFKLRPIANNVGDLIEMIKKEDKGIDRVVCKTMDGTRIGSSNTIESLLEEDFKLVINDVTYNVNTPKAERLAGDEVKKLDDVKLLISRLYEAMNVQDHQVSKEVELRTQLEQIQQELQPLEQKKLEIEEVAARKSNWLAWAGLGLMSVQFGILARLTWWEYSWDIMEPVTYFVTYGTAMACYAYFVVTKEEYVLQDVRNRQQLITLHKKAKKTGFDLNQYNMLKMEAARIQYMLKKLRNPLKLKLPPKITAGAAAAAFAADTNAAANSASNANTVAAFATAMGGTSPGARTATVLGATVAAMKDTQPSSATITASESSPTETTAEPSSQKPPSNTSQDIPKK